MGIMFKTCVTCLKKGFYCYIESCPVQSVQHYRFNLENDVIKLDKLNTIHVYILNYI